MTISTKRRRGIALAAVSAVAASTLLGLPAAQAAAPVPTHGATVDYFDDVYTDLGANSVFETVTVERFEYLLKKPGNFAFLIGDPNNATTQATIGQINAEAKARGITKIYNFTPKLDGDKLNVWDLSQSNLRTETLSSSSGPVDAGLAQFEVLGNRLIDSYLNKDTTPEFDKDAETDPYLFVYNKDRTVGTDQDRIVSSLTGVKTAADLDTDTERTAYRAQVGSVLGSVTELATNTQFEFNRDEHNRRHYERYVQDKVAGDPAVEAANRARYGGDILDASDNADGFRIETITYPELKHILTKSGDFSFLFGGTWCHNTAAIIKDTNRLAQAHGIKKVYNFDFSLDSTGNAGTAAQHIRDNARLDPATGKVLRPSHLYGDLVNEYLTNAETQYRTTDDVAKIGGSVNAVQYYPGGDTTKPLKEARKIQVGHVLTYNKDRVDALGNRAPVVDQAIRQNDDGGNTEHMTEWWFVQGRDLPAGDAALRGSANPASEAGSNGLQNQRAFAKEAIDEIDTVLAGVADQTLASTTSVTGLGGATDPIPGVGATPTVAVSVASAGYSPFISLNSANASTAPSSAAGKPRGFVAVFDGDEQLGNAVRLSRTGTANVTLPAQTAGEKSYTVRYLGRGDAIAPSAAELEFTVAGDESTTELELPASLVFGAGGTVTATVPEDATGTVTLTGLPGAPIVAQVDEGAASIALPATIPAGTHAVVATYSGDDKYASSADEQPLTIAKGGSAVKSTATGASYGASARVDVTSTGPNGYVPTGTVRVSVAGGNYAATLDAQGRATVALPTTLLPKVYAVTVIHEGDANVRASSTTTTLTVAKGSASAPKFAKKGTVKAGKKGKATVTVKTPSGLVKAAGKVKIVLTKGKVKKTITKSLSSGKANVSLPKLVKGNWKVKVTYLGDTTYKAGKTVNSTLKVK